MANVLISEDWLSAPTKKPSLLARLLRVQVETRQRRADRVVEQYIATHGLINYRMTLNDRSSVYFLRGASSHGHAHHRARSKEARSLGEGCF